MRVAWGGSSLSPYEVPNLIVNEPGALYTTDVEVLSRLAMYAIPRRIEVRCDWLQGYRNRRRCNGCTMDGYKGKHRFVLTPSKPYFLSFLKPTEFRLTSKVARMIKCPRGRCRTWDYSVISEQTVYELEVVFKSEDKSTADTDNMVVFSMVELKERKVYECNLRVSMDRDCGRAWVITEVLSNSKL